MDKVGIWAQKTTCHGIVDLYDSKSFIQRLFWGIVIAAAFGAIGFYQYSVVCYYLTVPTATKISKFPAVFINNPWATPTSFLGYVSFGAGYFIKLGYRLISSSGSRLMELQYQTVFNSTTSNYSLKQFLMDTGYQCEDIFSWSDSCMLSLFYFSCCKNAIQIPSDLGNCYELRPALDDGTNIYQVQQGMDFGMMLTLTYNDSDSPNFPYTPIKNDGFEITIGEMMTKMNTARVAVAPRQQVSISVTLQKYVFDPTITTCADNPTDLAYTVGGKKSVLLCQQECQFNMSIKYSGCSRVVPNVNMSSDQICSPRKYLYTYYYNSLLLNKTFLSDMFYCQESQCHKLCKTDLYVPFAVYSGVTPGTSSTGITIYYGELAYTLIVENPLMDVVGLVSSFGGNLGLFARMSLVTIVQFIAHLLHGCKSFLTGSKRNNIGRAVSDGLKKEDNPITGIPRPIHF